ncbi:MAG: hypothetical protein U0271_41400 [Polyangiaceae bacterium]
MKELIEGENARLAELEQQQAEATKAQHRAKMEAELRIVAAAEAKRRADDERRRSEAAAERELQARHEAMRVAAIERVRLESAQKARLEELAFHHTSELERTRRQAARDRRVLQRTLGSLVALTFFTGVLAVGYHFGVSKPNEERERALAAESIRMQELENQRLRNQIDTIEAGSADLTAQPTAPPEPTNAPVQVKPPVSATPTVRPPTIHSVKPPPPPPPPTQPCNPLDPIAECVR